MNIPLFRPMFPSPKPLLDDAGFVHEVKWDGYRAMMYLIDHNNVEIRSRNGRLLNSKFPEVISTIGTISKRTMVLDGEIVAFGEKGTPEFSLLQHNKWKETGQVGYIVFDLLYLDGESLCQLPWHQRRAYLDELAADLTWLTLSPVFYQPRQAVLDAVKSLGLEGVVSKSEQSPYLPGEHSLYWRKTKYKRTADCVLVGYFELGISVRSLCLAQYRENGELVYIGKAGSGLGDTERNFIQKASRILNISSCPVINPPSDEDRIAWFQPQIVVEVEYLEFTPQFRLRHPVFCRFRWDKQPNQCVLGGE
ncbi:MAG: hypothetical protein GX331_08810 [Firmicutes bacterium]|nr:hypothetical protein [Bacillota bacterium]